MNENDALNNLFFCNLCFFPYKHRSSRSSTLLISYCMHIVCTSCMEGTRICPVCSSDTSFVQINNSISKKLKRNASELFIRPVDVSMFQISSSLNLIAFLTDELASHKKLLLMAKREIERLKRHQKHPQPKLIKEPNKFTNHHHKKNNKSYERAPTVLNFSNLSTSSINQRISLLKSFKPYQKYHHK